MIKIATVCSGIGSPEQALKNMGVPHEISFACEIDKYARQTYQANFTPNMMLQDMTKESWEGEAYSSDLFIGGIPCQAFSLAGKRMGELDPRGLLFYDFYRYVKLQQPKVFIIENVKGLISDNKGSTFKNWLQLLGQSENRHYNMLNHPDSLMYNLHYKVLNSKDFGVPQNRERIFIVGIRSDLPNSFCFPIGERLKYKLRDVLELEVDEKFYLSNKAIQGFYTHTEKMKARGNGFEFSPTDGNCIASTVTTRSGSRPDDNFILVSKEKRTDDAKAERRHSGSNSFRGKELIFEEQDYMNCIQTGPTNETLIMVQEATKKGYAIAHEGDSINLLHPDSKTRKGRVGKGIANTIDTGSNQAVVVNHGYQLTQRIRRLTPLECMRLQGFPDEYIKPCSDTQTYKQAGNSITVNVMQAIISRLIEIIHNRIAA